MPIPQPLYRCDTVREIDRAAIQHERIDGYTLMCRAGAAAFERLRRHWPQARRLLVVCGGGNNGGDGYVLARLARAAGFDVQLLALQSRVPADAAARQAQHDWSEAGGAALAFAPDAALPTAELIVDALFGIGLCRPPDAAAAALIDAINAHPAPVFALDVPSGVDADRGAVPGNAVHAERTLCFIAGKRGLYTSVARDHCGVIEVDPLGVAAAVFEGQPVAAWRLDADALQQAFPPRHPNAHKGEHGHVLVVGGDLGFGGALRLAAEAALRVGAGLVSALTRSAHRGGLLAAVPECMTWCSDHGELPVDLLHRIDVLALGPGLGTGEWGRDLFPRLLGFERPMVLDADALNLLAAEPRPLAGQVLTPHPGEAARLLGMPSAAAVQADRFGAAEQLVARYQSVVVLKGAGTLVAGPGEAPRIIDAGNPGMASGGMGDVLTGVIAGLLAQRWPAFEAAVTGALLHAAAGDLAAADGARGLLARDLFGPLRRLANP